MEKESVKKFDLEAAFKALDEIDIPQVKGIKANRVNLKERFAQKPATETLVEDYYDVSNNEDLEEAQEEREGEVAQAKLARIEKIVDLDAESPDDLLPSYVGKVIMQCPQCMTLFYKNPEDIEHSEENPDVVNINEVCQHCGNTSGYTLIGKVGAVSEDEASEYQSEEAPAEAEEENELDLDFETEEEPAEEATEESGEEDLDLDLNLEEIPEEGEEKNESLNLSKEATSDFETEHKSENLTLNEDVGDDELLEPGEAPEAQKAPEVSAFIDCSGSWRPETIEACGKRAIDENSGCKVNLFYFSDHVYTDMDQACRGGATAAGPEIIQYAQENPDIQVLVYTDEDMLHQGGKALFDGSIPNVKLIRVDLGESLNKSEEAPSENETENGSENLTLNEDVDKDLDKKLKEHNDYIAFIQAQIKETEEALKGAENDEIKDALQRRLDSLNVDLESALPDAVKGEPVIAKEESALADEAQIEEPAEEVSEEEPVDEPVDEALTEEAEEPKEKIGLIDLSGSLIEAEEKLVKQAKADGCTKLYKSSQQGSFEKLYNFAKANADADLVIYTNDDINHNPFGKEIKELSNVKIVDVGETGEVEESLNASEEAPSENETENGSENTTLNENLNEEGNAKWNALSSKPKGELARIKKDPDWEATDKYIIWGTDVKGNVLVDKEVSGKPADAKAARDALLKDNEEVIDTYVSQYWKNIKTKEEKDIPLYGYMKSRKGYKYTTEELKEDAEPNEAAKALDDYLKDEEPKEECLKEAEESPAEVAEKIDNFISSLPEGLEECGDKLQEAPSIDSILDDFIKSLPESLEECGDKLQEAPKFDDVSDEDFGAMLKSETFNESALHEAGNSLPSRAVINAIADRILHAGDEVEDEANEGYTGNPAERTTHLEYTDDDPTDGEAVLPDNIEKQLTEDAAEEPVKDEEAPAKEEPAGEEPQPIETTVEEVKEVAADVAEEVLEKAEAEVEPEVVEETVNEVVEEKFAEEEIPEDEKEFSEDELDDLDESSLNEHINSYLTEVYSNVKCFEATGCEFKDKKLVVEGKISFNSGNEKLTIFEFLPAYCEGKLFFEGYNKDLAEDKAFTLNCSINESKTLITESFGYKYKINENLVEGLK